MKRAAAAGRTPTGEGVVTITARISFNSSRQLADEQGDEFELLAGWLHSLLDHGGYDVACVEVSEVET